jgi:hypothetical protein
MPNKGSFMNIKRFTTTRVLIGMLAIFVHASSRGVDLEISGTIDGTDQIVISQESAKWVHFFGDLTLTHVTLNNFAWQPSTQPVLQNSGDTLFLSNRVNFLTATVVRSSGRDTVVMERFSDHITISFADTPLGPADYSIQIEFRTPPTLLIDADIDGSDELQISYSGARWIHKQWSWPANVQLNAVVWDPSTNDYLTNAPPTLFLPAPVEFANATILWNTARDLVTLRPSADGLIVNFADNPVGPGHVEVAIGFPTDSTVKNTSIAVVSTMTIDPIEALGVTISTIRGVWYELESATTLSPPDWTGTGGLVRGDGGLMSLFDPSQSQTAHFYRIVSRVAP